MICDALKEVGVEMKLAERSQNVTQFIRLKDSLLDHIVDTYDSETLGARRAREILGRIETRNLYTMCGEKRIHEDYARYFENNEAIAMEIVNHQSVNTHVQTSQSRSVRGMGI